VKNQKEKSKRKITEKSNYIMKGVKVVAALPPSKRIEFNAK